MMPIVFWASLVPWESENAAADPSCARRNQRSTEPYGVLWKIQDSADHQAPSRRPSR